MKIASLTTRLAALLPLVLAANCGGSSSSTTEEPACSDGDTRACFGPGACEGGQECRNESWSTCDCGSAGGSAGSGTSGSGGYGDAGETGTASGGTENAGGDSGENGGAPEQSGGEGGAGEPTWVADPCPEDPVEINCSSQCGGPTESCANVALCEGSADFEYALYLDEAESLVIRTSDLPGNECACTEFSDAFSFRIQTSDIGYARVTVNEPWVLENKAPMAWVTTCEREEQKACLDIIDDELEAVVVYTREVAAPAVNILIEDGKMCP